MTKQVETILRTQQLVRLLGVSATTFHRIRKEPGFPPAIRLSTRARGYRLSDVDAWLKKRETETLSDSGILHAVKSEDGN